ncbi:MAG: hypothetical protein ACYDHW_07145 [Syntrophorhabdaceae bacterium]
MMFGDMRGQSSTIPALNENERKHFLYRLRNLSPKDNSVFVRVRGKMKDGSPITALMLLQAFYDGNDNLEWISMTGWIDKVRDMVHLKAGGGGVVS